MGSIDTYNANADIDVYLERCDLYFLANNVGYCPTNADAANKELAQIKKTAALLSVIGDCCYKTLKANVDPESVTSFSYEQLCLKLRQHYKPVKLELLNL